MGEVELISIVTSWLTLGFSVLRLAWRKVLLGDIEEDTVENHSVRSKYVAWKRITVKLMLLSELLILWKYGFNLSVT